MKLLYALALGLLLTTGSFIVQAQTEVDVAIDLVYSDDGTITGYPTGFNTWRIYALLENSDDFLSSVYAAMTGPTLTINTSTNQIWNSSNGAIQGGMIDPDLFTTDPAAEYDSWITLGLENDEQGGFMDALCLFPTQTTLNEAFDAPLSSDEIDGNLYIEDGIWFTLMGNDNGLPEGPDNRVLIAQVTTDGNIEVCMNFQVFPNGMAGELTEYDNYCNEALAPLSVDEVQLTKASLTPNPSTGPATLQLDPTVASTQIEVLSLTGDVVERIHTQTSNVTLDPAELSAGVYLVRMQYGNGLGTETLRWVVQ